jgi:hypothetical protein
VIAKTDHNYDLGSLWVSGDDWKIIAPTSRGPQPYGGDMCFCPAEGDRDDVMELGEGALTADQDPPPDHRADPADPDMELVGRRN